MKNFEDNIPSFIYNDEYDEKHYPVQDFMYDRLVEVNQYLELGDGKEWYYNATAFGVIFETYTNDIGRLNLDALKFFSNLKDVRWIDSGKNSFKLALNFVEGK